MSSCSLVDRIILKREIRTWRRRIVDSLGREGCLSAQDEEFLESNPELVVELESEFFLALTGKIEKLIENLLQSGRFYLHGKSEPNFSCLRAMIEYGHFDLVDQIIQNYTFKIAICGYYIEFGHNNRINFDGYDKCRLGNFMRTAIEFNNVKIVQKLRDVYRITLNLGYRRQMVKSNNPEFLELFYPFSDVMCRKTMKMAIKFDSEQIVQHLLNNYHYDHDAILELFEEVLDRPQSPKVLECLIRMYPDIDVYQDILVRRMNIILDSSWLFEDGHERVIELVCAEMNRSH